MANVNLDALIAREDFDVDSTGEPQVPIQSIRVNDLDAHGFLGLGLRKPDFQRETSDWPTATVVGLIRSFLAEELIPAVILWKSGGLNFVIDGSHRVSALLAWIYDDYGDRTKSQDFFQFNVPDDQEDAAKRTREAVEKEFGKYADHQAAITNPKAYEGTEILARAMKLATAHLDVQWVTGDARKAEDSFFRINSSSAKITPDEKVLLQTRRQPGTIAARAILRGGTGYKYWKEADPVIRSEIEKVSADIHRMIFEPVLHYPIKSIDVPPGGGVYAATALGMVRDFVDLCVGGVSAEEDPKGTRTLAYLKQCQRAMRVILDNHISSVGLCPAVYFYSWTGKQQPILFLSIAEFILDSERKKKLRQFLAVRKDFEEFLLNHKPLAAQIIRKFGVKAGTYKRLREYYDVIEATFRAGKSADDALAAVQDAFPFLQPNESPYEGVTATKFSTQVKSGLAMRELLEHSVRCKLCGGFLPGQAFSNDHIMPKEHGGAGVPDNWQLTHPVCNSIKGSTTS